MEELPIVRRDLLPIIPTKVYDTYWRFAAERQEIFFRRFEGHQLPWTTDKILMKFKFTNAYRASDRVSQFLIRKVIYNGEQSPNELFFRIILFKIFNRIDTWCLLNKEIGDIEFRNYSYKKYDDVLTKALADGKRIFSAAYIMPSGKGTFGSSRKHRNFLMLLEKMMKDDVPKRISQCKYMKDAFELLRSYPLMGDFLAYQYSIDLNYSTLTNFSEMEFVIPGPGAKDGIRKCFRDLGGLSNAEVIRFVIERQNDEFNRLGIKFRSLFGRSLQLIDGQNLFCEVDKYARVAHPDFTGRSGRTRIKQVYQSVAEQINYWYPPKWGINNLVEERGKHDNSI